MFLYLISFNTILTLNNMLYLTWNVWRSALVIQFCNRDFRSIDALMILKVFYSAQEIFFVQFFYARTYIVLLSEFFLGIDFWLFKHKSIVGCL